MEDEFENIKNWCLFIVEYISKKSQNDMMDEFKNNIKDLIKSNKSFKQLKSLKRDLAEWVGGLPINDIKELNNLLLIKFGETINSNNDKEIAKVVKREKINNDDEFRMINEKVNEIYQTNPKTSELEKLNHLLLMYEQGKIPS